MSTSGAFSFLGLLSICRLVVGRCEPTLLEHSVTVSTRGFDPRIHGSNPCAPASREGKHVNTLSSNRDKPPKTIPKYRGTAVGVEHGITLR